MIGDVEKALTLLVLGIIAWLSPARAWGSISRGLAKVTRHIAHMPGIWMPADLSVALGPAWNSSRTAEARHQWAATYFEERMQVTGSYRPGGWRPSIDLHGAEHIDDAVDAGSGAILWISEFASSDLVAKLALSEKGHPLAHLSRPTHGFSETSFGIRFLNLLRTRIEDRYLAARVPLPDDAAAVGAMRELRHRLEQNEVVSITVGDTGRQTTTVPFLAGRLTVATGAPSLAAAAGAALLPVFTIRRATNHYEVHIGAPIAIADRDARDALAETAAAQLADQLAEHVSRAPGLWRAWNLFSPS